MRYVAQAALWLAVILTLAAAGAMNIRFLTSWATDDTTAVIYGTLAVVSLLVKAGLAAYVANPRGSKVLLYGLLACVISFDAICGIGFSAITRGSHMSERETLASELKRLDAQVTLAQAELAAIRAEPAPPRPVKPAASYKPLIATLEARGLGCDSAAEMRWQVCREASALRAERETALAAGRAWGDHRERLALAEKRAQDARAKRDGIDLAEAGKPVDPLADFMGRQLANAGVPYARDVARFVAFVFVAVIVLLLELVPIVCVREAMRPAPVDVALTPAKGPNGGQKAPKPGAGAAVAPPKAIMKPAKDTAKEVWDAIAGLPQAGAAPIRFKLGDLAEQIGKSKTAIRNTLKAWEAAGVIALETGRQGCQVEILGEPA